MVDKKVTKELIEHLSNLAKLKLSEEQSEKFSHQIESILDYVDQVAEVDTGEEFKTQTDLRSITREDLPKASLTQEKSVSGRKNAQVDGYFTVKTVINK